MGLCFLYKLCAYVMLKMKRLEFCFIFWSGNAALGVQGGSKLFYSTGSLDGDNENEGNNDGSVEIDDDDFLPERPELKVQSVDPRKGWNYRGVHKVLGVCSRSNMYKIT